MARTQQVGEADPAVGAGRAGGAAPHAGTGAGLPNAAVPPSSQGCSLRRCLRLNQGERDGSQAELTSPTSASERRTLGCVSCVPQSYVHPRGPESQTGLRSHWAGWTSRVKRDRDHQPCPTWNGRSRRPTNALIVARWDEADQTSRWTWGSTAASCPVSHGTSAPPRPEGSAAWPHRPPRQAAPPLGHLHALPLPGAPPLPRGHPTAPSRGPPSCEAPRGPSRPSAPRTSQL